MRRNILMIDDDPDARALIKAYLKESGCNVRAIQDGFAALDELRDNVYDLLILDISMPQLSGFRILKAIRATEEHKDLPVVMLTASSDKDDVLKAQSDVSDYILKPVKRSDFVARIEKILSTRPPAPAIRLDKDDPLTWGAFEVPVRLTALNSKGFMLTCPVAAPKGHILRFINLGILRKIGLADLAFKVMDCRPNGDGGYDYYISFSGLRGAEQKKIQIWMKENNY